MTLLTAAARDELSSVWHAYLAGRTGSPTELLGADRFNSFMFAKDWLQDTAEALLVHRQDGFSRQPHKAYLEFWGVLQAVFVQQDAISVLYKAVIDIDLNHSDLDVAWSAVRNLRNRAAGHPTTGERATPKGPTATGRQPKTYDRIVMQVGLPNGKTSSEEIALGKMVDAYDVEAARVVRLITRHLSLTIDAHLSSKTKSGFCQA